MTTIEKIPVNYSMKSDQDKQLDERLDMIDNMSDEEVFSIIFNNIGMFLNNDINNPKYDFLKTSSKFIHGLINVVEYRGLTYEERILINDMIYHSLLKKNLSGYICALYYILGKTANTNKVLEIMEKCKLSMPYSSILAVARKSSFDSKINIKRFLDAIMCIDKKIVSDQLISDILCVNLSYIDEIKDLFIYIMMDSGSLLHDKYIKANCIDIYNHLVNAIIAIVNSLEENQIRNIIESYYGEVLINGSIMVDLRKYTFNRFPKIDYIIQSVFKYRFYSN